MTLLERNETRPERSEMPLERKDTHLTGNDTRSGNLHLSGTVRANILLKKGVFIYVCWLESWIGARVPSTSADIPIRGCLAENNVFVIKSRQNMLLHGCTVKYFVPNFSSAFSIRL